MANSVSPVQQRREVMRAVPSALVLVVVCAVLLRPGAPAETRELASGAGLLLAGIFTGLGCAVRARRCEARRRGAWTLLAAAAAVAVLGNLWLAAAGQSDPVSHPSTVSDLSVAAALSLSILALLRFPTAHRRGVDQLLMVLDALIMGASVLVIASSLVYTELLESSTTASVHRVTALVIPVLDVVLATVAAMLLLRTRGSDQRILALVSLGFVMYAVTDLAFAVLVAQGEFRFGTWMDLGWIAGYLLIGLAAWHPTTQPESGEDTVAEASDTLTIFVFLLAAAVVQVLFGGAGGLQVTHAGLWLFLIVAAGTRQVVLTHDNVMLRRGLERRVREQTADLRRLVRQHDVLLTSVRDGIYGVDLEGRVTFVNPSGAAALGADPAELLGRVAHDVFHAPDPVGGTPYPASGCYVTEAISSGTVSFGEEDVYVRADQTTFPVEITASPLVHDGASRPHGAVVVFRDVTQRHEVDRMKNEFLSVVSHELRTPLTSIRGSLGLLAGGTLGELTPRAVSMTTMALESTERLTRLINDILDLERIESGSRPLDLREYDAYELVAAALMELEGLARTASVVVTTGDVTGRVLADKDRVVQTLTNLVGNAVKFSERGASVVLCARPGGTQVVFEVRDQGRGIPEDRLQSIFDRFEQVDSSDARTKGGTGLGLAISRGIVERHGGRIWAESVLGAGSVVSFTLPASPTAIVPLTDPEGHEPHDAPTIVVCDDDPATVGVFTAMLRRHGYRTIGVSDGAAALSAVSAERPAALLLDLVMPGTTGVQVVADLRASERTREIPVVVISGMAPDEVEVPAEDWLIKPVSEERLLRTLGLVLEGRRRDATVLLVEDDLDLGRVLVSLLSAHGVRVVQAVSAAEAVRRGRELRPQVVVLDLALPDGDGDEVVAGFRADPELASTALVVYSASDVEATRRPGLSLGRTEFLTKGRSGPEVLEDRVLALLGAVTGRHAGADT